MSRDGEAHPLGDAGFPRVSGDEPRCIFDLSAFFVFSPRERG